MARRKVLFAFTLFFSCLGMILLTIQNFELCSFCFNPGENEAHYDLNSNRKSFMKLPAADCKESPPFLVLLVTTTHRQKVARSAIRQTWGKERWIQGKRVVTYFLLGSRAKKHDIEETKLAEEDVIHRDLIQRDFIDSYYNLTLKTLLGIDWLTHQCPQASYAMKTDTDMFINVFYLVELLLLKNQSSNLFTGILKPDDRPIRNQRSKWYISKREFTGEKYPPFCSGTGYVFSADVAMKIYNVSRSVQYFKLEDVYIGMCLDKLKIPLQTLHTREIFFASKPSFSVCVYRKLVTAHQVQPQEIRLYWEALMTSLEEPCS